MVNQLFSISSLGEKKKKKTFRTEQLGISGSRQTKNLFALF